jgi:hypothetical protein
MTDMADPDPPPRKPAPAPPPEVLDAAAAAAANPPADPLAEIVDDYAPRQDAIEYAVAELAAERSFEDVAADLTAAGWPGNDADEIVESARQQTRGVRGARTRDDVLRQANAHYRQASRGGWFIGFPSIASVMRLLHALGSLASLKRRPPRT